MSGNNVYVNVIEISSTGWVSKQRLRIDELVRKVFFLVGLSLASVVVQVVAHWTTD